MNCAVCVCARYVRKRPFTACDCCRCVLTWSVRPAHLVAVAEAHAAEGGQLGLQAVMPRVLRVQLVVELLPLDLLPHAPGLLDGLQHGILVPKERRGVEAGQDVFRMGQRDNGRSL